MPRDLTAFLKSWLVYWLPLSVRNRSCEQSGFSAAMAFVMDSIATCLVASTSKACYPLAGMAIYYVKAIAPSIYSTPDVGNVSLPQMVWSFGLEESASRVN